MTSHTILMNNNRETDSPIYALDFDGVICDSAIETAMTGWKVAQTIWPDIAKQPITTELIEQFRAVRPVLETGYEAILIMRLLQQRHTAQEICHQYDSRIAETIASASINTQQLKQWFGETRDHWIANNEADWLRNNPLFSGIADQLKTLAEQDWYIITTKQERFVQKILEASDIHLAPDAIFGMDRQLSKQQILEDLLAKHPNQLLVFIEDRLPTLLGIQENPALRTLQLQLVDWGYNTKQDRYVAQQNKLEIISQGQFLQTDT
ncbi:MAG: Unknown protein [uncultured Thiotrichaceae bacterium]|uniref:HAD family hydrolase n=1 Tax=uncultured Thiotrichaceae bacterium TaxID=298394 RepID=A0A6S6T9Y5_9GAMM|nr:MAG: Unknown protein [uncultured Thiotrichaceae bacterium]